MYQECMSIQTHRLCTKNLCWLRPTKIYVDSHTQESMLTQTHLICTNNLCQLRPTEEPVSTCTSNLCWLRPTEYVPRIYFESDPQSMYREYEYVDSELQYIYQESMLTQTHKICSKNLCWLRLTEYVPRIYVNSDAQNMY